MRLLVRESLPLMLTFLMMAGATPFIGDGISHRFDAAAERIHLASFSLAFVLAILLYSPLLTSRNVALRSVRDRLSLRATFRFYTLAASTCSLLLVLPSLCPSVRDLLFGRLLGASDPLVRQEAATGLLAFTPLPFLVGWRGILQAGSINERRSWVVGLSSVTRLVAMGLFVWAYVSLEMPFGGAVMGGLCFCAGIIAETSLNLALSRPRFPQTPAQSSQPPEPLQPLWRFALPVMGSTLIAKLLHPLGFVIIQTVADPEAALAGHSLTQSTVWVLLSFLFVAQPLILSFADTRAHFRLVLRFLAGLSLLTGLAILGLCLPGVRESLFEDLMRVDNRHILDLTYAALPWTVLVVPVQLASMIANSLVLRSGDTRVLISSGLLALLPVAMIPLLVDIPAANGVIITIGAYILYHAGNALLLALHLRRRGLDSCFEAQEKSAPSPS
ncbi:MAG: hypothetical protein RL095_2465 [Verrucomicrobiota bacterium]